MGYKRPVVKTNKLILWSSDTDHLWEEAVLNLHFVPSISVCRGGGMLNDTSQIGFNMHNPRIKSINDQFYFSWLLYS